VGAAATGTALAVVLLAKFREGAWITVLIVPALLYLFYRVKRHYNHLARETNCPRPIDLRHLRPPLVVIPVLGWNTITDKALQFGLRLSTNIIAVHVVTEEAAQEPLRQQWEQYVEQPIRNEGLCPPRLEFLTSPYRHLITPLLDYLKRLEEQHPGRQIAVIIPELVETTWYQYLMHNQTAAVLKAALLFRGNQRIVVINVPWYLNDQEEVPAAGTPVPVSPSRAKAAP